MKKQVKKISIAGLMSLGLLLQPACAPFDLSTDDLQLSVDFSIFRTYFSINYLDAKTGELIGLSGDADLEVELSCNRDNLITDTEGRYTRSLQPAYGFFTLTLDPWQDPPDPQNPVIITIRTRSPQHVESIRTIRLFEERSVSYDFGLISRTAPPDGIVSEKTADAGQAGSTGAVSESILLTTSNEASGIDIAAGAVLQTATGEPLSGSLSVELMSVDVTQQEAFLNLPGLDQPLITEYGSHSSLVSAVGYTRIDITDGAGRRAARVSGEGLVVQTRLPAGIINPYTRAAVQAGDEVAAYHFDEEDATWKFVGKDRVQELNGGLVLVRDIRGFKTGEGGAVGQFAWSFDQSAPKDYVIGWTLDPGLLVPLELHAQYDIEYPGGIRKTGDMNIVLDDHSGQFWLYSLPDLSATTLDFSFDIADVALLNRSNLGFVGAYPGWNIQIDSWGGGSQGSRLVHFELNLCDEIVLKGENLPNFTAIFSGTGFERETVRLISNGVMTIPFDPEEVQDGSWQGKIIFNNTREYPEGSERIAITASDFVTETIDGQEKITFRWVVTEQADCDEIKGIIGL